MSRVYQADQILSRRHPMFSLGKRVVVYDNIKLWFPANAKETDTCGAGKEPQAPYRLEHFVLENDRLRINGVRIPQDCMRIQGKSIVWKYGEEGFYTAGNIHFFSHMAAGFGIIWLGTSKEDSVAMQYTAGLSPVTMSVKLANTGMVCPAGKEWEPKQHTFGWMPDQAPETAAVDMRFVYYWDINAEQLIVKLQKEENGILAEYDYTDYFALDYDGDTPSHNLIFSLDENEEAVYEVCEDSKDARWPVRGKLRLAFDGKSAEGLVTLPKQPIGNKIEEQTQDDGQLLLCYISCEEVQDACSLAREQIRGIRKSAAKRTHFLGEKNSTLTGQDLLLVQVDAEKVQAESFRLLTENMTWCLCQDEKKKEWVDHFIGVTCPKLSEKRIADIEGDQTNDPKAAYQDAKSWYQNSMSMYWLGSKLGNISASEGGPKKPLDAGEQKKLDFWIQGAKTEKSGYFYGIQSERFYSTQTRALAETAFYNCCAQVCPDLDSYLAEQKLFRDTDGRQGKDWAQWYYDQMATPNMLSQQAARVKTLKDTSVLNNICSLLNLLEPYRPKDDQAKCARYYSKVLSLAWAKEIKNVTWWQEDHDDLAKWIQNVIMEFCDAVEKKKEAGDPEYQPGGKHYSEVVTAEILKDIQLSVGGWLELADALTECILAAKQIEIYPKWLDHILDSIGKKFENVPKLKKYGPVVLRGVIKMLVSGLQMLGLFFAYSSWDDLNDLERSEAVLGTIGVVYNGLSDVMKVYKDYLDGKAVTPKEPTNMEIEARVSGSAADPANIEVMDSARTLIDGEHTDVEIARNIERDVVSIEGGEVKIKEDSWLTKKIKSGKAEKFLKGFGLLLDLAMSIVMTIDFHNALRDPNHTDLDRAFLGISMASGWISFGLQLAGFSAELELITMGAQMLACVTFAAEIFAVLGVLSMILYLCFAPKPARIIDTFMDDFRKSDWFIGLHTPPEDWDGKTVIATEDDKNMLADYVYP